MYFGYLFRRQIFLGLIHVLAAVIVHYLDVLSEPHDDFSRRASASAIHGAGATAKVIGTLRRECYVHGRNNVSSVYIDYHYPPENVAETQKVVDEWLD
jgi:hypothetical protein